LDTLTFIVEMTKALAWPGGAVGTTVLLRKPLRLLLEGLRLKNLKVAGVEAEFSREWAAQAQQVVAELSALPADTKPSPKFLDTFGTAVEDASPLTTIVTTWVEIERRVREAVKDTPVDGDITSRVSTSARTSQRQAWCLGRRPPSSRARQGARARPSRPARCGRPSSAAARQPGSPPRSRITRSAPPASPSTRRTAVSSRMPRLSPGTRTHAPRASTSRKERKLAQAEVGDLRVHAEARDVLTVNTGKSRDAMIGPQYARGRDQCTSTTVLARGKDHRRVARRRVVIGR
jgi:hypothetical protein